MTSAPIETTNGGSADQIVAHATGANVQACYVYATLTDSVCWASGANGKGMEAQTLSNTTITVRNVTLEATGSGGIGARLQAGSPASVTVNMTNVIARGLGSDISLTEISGATLVANLDHTNHANPATTGSPTVNETNQQTAAPLFANAASGDFREAAGSPPSTSASPARSTVRSTSSASRARSTASPTSAQTSSTRSPAWRSRTRTRR